MMINFNVSQFEKTQGLNHSTSQTGMALCNSFKFIYTFLSHKLSVLNNYNGIKILLISKYKTIKITIKYLTCWLPWVHYYVHSVFRLWGHANFDVLCLVATVVYRNYVYFYFINIITILTKYTASRFYQDKLRFSLCTVFRAHGCTGTTNCLLVSNIVVNYLNTDFNYPILFQNNKPSNSIIVYIIIQKNMYNIHIIYRIHM